MNIILALIILALSGCSSVMQEAHYEYHPYYQKKYLWFGEYVERHRKERFIDKEYTASGTGGKADFGARKVEGGTYDPIPKNIGLGKAN